MLNTARLVVSLHDAQSEDERIVGQRAARIAHLRNGKFPVPSAFVVTAKAMSNFLEANNLTEFISRHLANLNILNQPHVDAVSREITKRINRAVVPEHLAVEIAKHYNRLGGNQTVRLFISAPVNIVPQSHFFETMSSMEITSGDANVIETVKAVWAMGFTSNLLNYRSKFPQLKEKPLFSVCVQQLPTAESSGILMTQQDNTNKPHMLIESLLGYPQPIIDGSLTPDQYIYDRVNGHMLSAEIIPQAKQLTVKRNSFEYKNVVKKEQDIINISKNNISKLGELGKKIHQYNFYPQYVVWLANNKGVQILESFPLSESSVAAKVRNQQPESLLKNLDILVQGQPASKGIVSGPAQFWTAKTKPEEVTKDAILIAEKITPMMFPFLKAAKGVVAQKGGITSHAAILAREIGLPCVVGATEIYSNLKKNQIITIDGSAGVVYKGSSTVKRLSPKATSNDLGTIKTSIFLLQQNLVTEKLEIPHDSLFAGSVSTVIDSLLLTAQGQHRFFNHLAPSNKSEQLVTQLQKTYERFGQRPVWIKLSDNTFHNSQANNAPSISGYRGSLRLIHEKNTLTKEVEAILEAAQRLQSQVQILLPFVRYPAELHTLRKLIKDQTSQNAKLRFGLLVQTPAIAYNLQEFLSYDIEDVFIDIPTLSQTLFSLDKTSYRAESFYDETHPLLKKLIAQLYQQTKSSSVKLSVIIPSGSAKLIEELIAMGISRLVVPEKEAETVLPLIKEAEQRFLSLIN